MTKQQLTDAINRAFLTAAGQLAEILTPEEWEAMPDKEELITEAATVYLKGFLDAWRSAETIREIHAEQDNAGKE